MNSVGIIFQDNSVIIRLRIFIFLGIFFISNGSSAFAGEFPKFQFEQFTSENKVTQQGLSQNTVAAIHQDSYGFLWFGTWDGLNRFDGYSFLVYNRSHGLTSENITSISEDKSGNLWIGTDLGLNRMNLKTRVIESFRHNPRNSTSLSSDNILQIICNKTGKIIIVTSIGINVYNETENRFDPMFSKGSATLRAVLSTPSCIVEGSNAQYWVGTDSGLLSINAESFEYKLYRTLNGKNISINANRIRCLLIGANRNLWIGTNSGAIVMNIGNGEIIHSPSVQKNIQLLESNSIQCFHQDHFSNIWIGTESSGVYLAEPKTGNVTKIDNQSGLSNNRILCFYSDFNHNIWIGTFYGVTKLNPGQNIFKLFTKTGEPGSIPSSLIWDFLEINPGKIWIATDEGIAIFNAKTGKFEKFNPPNHDVVFSKRIRSLFRERNGEIWIGTELDGLYKFSVKTNTLTVQHIFDETREVLPTINFITEDNFGGIWVGTTNGVYEYNTDTKRWNAYYVNDKLAPTAFYSMLNGIDGFIWFGTNNGLLRYNPKKQTFNRQDNFFSFKGSVIEFFGLYQAPDGNIWVGSKNGGLILYDQKTGRFNSFTSKQGLVNNLVYAVIPDSNNCLWLSTNGGISRFNLNNSTFINFDIHDGLQSNEFNAGAYLYASNGEIYFGGVDGFNIFNPNQIMINTIPPRLAISAFRIFNEVQSRNLSDGDEVVLHAEDNFFSFEFSALDFSKPGKAKYAYMLEGLENDWNYTDASRRIAIYKKVSPGNYKFRLKASNEHGAWNDTGLVVSVKIIPQWYSRRSFQIIAFLLIVLGIALFVHHKLRQIRKKNRAERQLIEFRKHLFDVEQKTLRLQMNPHFIYNALNSIQSYVVSENNKNAVVYLSKFSRLMRMIFTNSQKSTIPLSEELKAINLYLEIEKLRFDTEFNFKVNVSDDIDEDQVEVPPLLIQPFIENSIIHGIMPKKGKGKISVEIGKTSNQTLQIIIEDNGIGRKQAGENIAESVSAQRPSALAIMQERCDLLTKQFDKSFLFEITDLYNSKGNPAGTRVEIKAPVISNNQKIS